MEFITFMTIRAAMDASHREEWVYSGVAKALNWLRTVPAPPEARIGPVGHGLARHKVFQDWEAPLEFSSTHALEIYINEVLFNTSVLSHRLLTTV